MSICKKIAFQNFKGFSFSDASITLLMCFSLSFCPPALGFEKLELGETVRVACLKLNVYSMPTAFSEITSKKKFGSSLKIMELLSIFELPNSDYSSRKKLEQAAFRAKKRGKSVNPITKKDYTRASWVLVGTGEYVQASCLVNENLFEEQTEELAEAKVIAVITQKAKRNFSEEEEGDLRAMKGVAGKALGGKADFELIDEIIAKTQGKIDLQYLKQFRKEGNLGEFK